jgi:hypothetical protein
MKGGALRRRRTWAWIAVGGVLIAILALVDVTTIDPRVTVRWRAEVGPADRVALERRYGLENGEQIEGTGWRYQLRDRSRDNIGALIRDPAVDDTGYIDRDALAAPEPDVRVTVRSLPFPFSVDDTDEGFRNPWQLFQLQSLWLLLAGGVVLGAAGLTNQGHRRNLAVAMLLAVGVAAFAFPISPTFVRMGDANQEVQSRVDFEKYAAVHVVRFEAHLTYAILDQLDRRYDRTEAAPERAQTALSRITTAWFVVCALAIGFLERWSPLVLRYLGLALLAPAALLYFGWREFGYLSLNVAIFPLLARGLRDGGWRIEGGSALAGLGAALHGFALVSVVGTWIAALAARARAADRVGGALRTLAWGTAAYLGWIAVYIIVLKRPIAVWHAAYFPWRPWLMDEILEGRVNAAILIVTGARDLLLTAWVVGAPLLVVAASLWRRHRDEVRTALGYAVPSMVFTILIWPVQGLGEEMDLVFTRFPAIYALAWVCAQDPQRTKIAAALLISGHLAFWRILLDARFINPAMF